MELVKFSPFSPWMSDRFFPLFDRDEWTRFPTQGGLEVFETDKEVVVKAPLPGIAPDKVRVTYEDENILRISAQSEETKEEREKKKVVHVEKQMRSYEYATPLHRPIDAEHITADMEDGVLTVKAPIIQGAKERRIQVSVKNK
jgi:HSP20 family protein